MGRISSWEPACKFCRKKLNCGLFLFFFFFPQHNSWLLSEEHGDDLFIFVGRHEDSLLFLFCFVL